MDASEPRGIIRGIPCPLFSSPSFGGHLQLNRGSFGNLPHSAITGGKHMRMCTGSTVGGSRFEPCAALHPILHDRGDYLLSFLSDCRERPARRLKAPAVIWSIGVVVTPLPSKQVSPVRIRYAPPAGRIRPFLSLVSLPIPQLTAGKDRPPG